MSSGAATGMDSIIDGHEFRELLVSCGDNPLDLGLEKMEVPRD